jgi:hypothetical protein
MCLHRATTRSIDERKADHIQQTKVLAAIFKKQLTYGPDFLLLGTIDTSISNERKRKTVHLANTIVKIIVIQRWIYENRFSD